jgi:hypothetical protein
MKHLFVVLTLGYWGKGQSLSQAAQNCHQAGSRKTEPALARLIMSPTDLPDLEKQVTVNDVGDILYPQTCEVIPLFSPQNSRVKLGSLICKTSTKH